MRIPSSIRFSLFVFLLMALTWTLPFTDDSISTSGAWTVVGVTFLFGIIPLCAISIFIEMRPASLKSRKSAAAKAARDNLYAHGVVDQLNSFPIEGPLRVWHLRHAVDNPGSPSSDQERASDAIRTIIEEETQLRNKPIDEGIKDRLVWLLSRDIDADQAQSLRTVF